MKFDKIYFKGKKLEAVHPMLLQGAEKFRLLTPYTVVVTFMAPICYYSIRQPDSWVAAKRDTDMRV